MVEPVISRPSSAVGAELLEAVDRPVYAVRRATTVALSFEPSAGDVIGWVPAIEPHRLGDPSFLEDHGVRRAYIGGALAAGIGSVEYVVALGQADMIGAFGAGGLDVETIDRALAQIETRLGGRYPFISNLLHNPQHPADEMSVADLYVRRSVRRVSASGYMGLTAPIVMYRAAGLKRRDDGRVVADHHVFAKISRPEIARDFMGPAPTGLLADLVAQGKLTPLQAELARQVPVAEDITAEGDSGGHTDRRPAVPLLSSICELRNRVVAEHGYDRPIRVGAAGGIATPSTVAATFAAGAAYVLTGSVNQACVEAGTSDLVKQMLAEVDVGGIAMAPAADMFELGVEVQVMKHRTLFAARARKLFDLYRRHASFEEIPQRDRQQIEQRILRQSYEATWEMVKDYFATHDPDRVALGERDPKKKMAFVFKWYLHMATRWATTGQADRSVDFQVWCGGAMAAFNHWARGTHLESPANRFVADVAENLMLGACVLLRARLLAMQGVNLPPAAFSFVPRPLRGIES